MKSIVLYFIVFLSSLMCWGQNRSAIEALDKMRNGYIVESFNDFNKFAMRNDILAQFFVAQCYEKGYGTMINNQEAFRYYRKAAERGLAIGQMALANCYRKGVGVTVNIQKAEYWETKAYGKYKEEDLALLDKCYQEGSKYPQNYHLATNGGGINNLANNVNVGNNVNSNNTTTNITYATPQPVQVSPVTPAPTPKEESVKSDVDINIPQGITKSEQTFVVILANENYRREEPVPYANNDGEIFKSYCIKALGIPEKNIKYVADASLNDLKYNLNWLKQVMEAYNGEAKAIFYYAGHGIPDEAQKTAYLLPVDGYGSDVTTGYKIDELYATLGKLPSKSVLVFLDACFSGSKRDGGMLASARGVAIKAKKTNPIGNMVVFSAAQGDETAYPYKEQRHGMFTYYLLKKLQETKGEATLGEISDYVTSEVRKQSIVINGKMQTPTLTSSSVIGDAWRNWKLK